MEHPERFPNHVFRGRCLAVMPNGRLLIKLDLGFFIERSDIFQLDNLSMPDAQSDQPAECHQAAAMAFRINEKVLDKPVLIIPYLQGDPMYPEWRANVFFFQPDIKAMWHSLEDHLVKSQLAAWLDEKIPAPSLA